MSRTNKNRKNLPRNVQEMWKDSGHQIRQNAFTFCSSDEFEDEPSYWEYRPLSRHTALGIHSSSAWDDQMTSYYADKVNWKYKNKVDWR